MNSTTFAALVSVAADYFFIALKATEDFDSFLRTVRDGMRATIAAEYDAADIERIHYASDGGGCLAGGLAHSRIVKKRAQTPPDRRACLRATK